MDDILLSQKRLQHNRLRCALEGIECELNPELKKLSADIRNLRQISKEKSDYVDVNGFKENFCEVLIRNTLDMQKIWNFALIEKALGVDSEGLVADFRENIAEVLEREDTLNLEASAIVKLVERYSKRVGEYVEEEKRLVEYGKLLRDEAKIVFSEIYFRKNLHGKEKKEFILEYGLPGALAFFGDSISRGIRLGFPSKKMIEFRERVKELALGAEKLLRLCREVESLDISRYRKREVFWADELKKRGLFKGEFFYLPFTLSNIQTFARYSSIHLDNLRQEARAEGKKMQKIFLKHFEKPAGDPYYFDLLENAENMLTEISEMDVALPSLFSLIAAQEKLKKLLDVAEEKVYAYLSKIGRSKKEVREILIGCVGLHTPVVFIEVSHVKLKGNDFIDTILPSEYTPLVLHGVPLDIEDRKRYLRKRRQYVTDIATWFREGGKKDRATETAEYMSFFERTSEGGYGGLSPGATSKRHFSWGAISAENVICNVWDDGSKAMVVGGLQAELLFRRWNDGYLKKTKDMGGNDFDVTYGMNLASQIVLYSALIAIEKGCKIFVAQKYNPNIILKTVEKRLFAEYKKILGEPYKIVPAATIIEFDAMRRNIVYASLVAAAINGGFFGIVNLLKLAFPGIFGEPDYSDLEKMLMLPLFSFNFVGLGEVGLNLHNMVKKVYVWKLDPDLELVGDDERVRFVPKPQDS